MADQKITQLTENTSPILTDILPMVDDPGASPATQKVTISNLLLKNFPYGFDYQDAAVTNPAGTSYAASAGTDPAVTLTLTGTAALVIVTARITGAGNYHFVSFAVSGASTVGAADSKSVSSHLNGDANTYSRAVLLTGLTAGSNTFTMQYRCNVSASGGYDQRSLFVIGLPT